MTISRRTLLSSAAALSAIPLIGAVTGSARAASETVAIASLHDLSGPLNAFGIPSHMCMKFAVEEINAGGGLLGKTIVLKTYDGQSNINMFPQYAQQAILQDHVVMLQGAITGASREATRPVMRRYKVPFIYGTIYEGGLCEKNVFCVNTGGNQQVVPLLEWSFANLGKKLYYIASDYNAPRNFGIWNHYIAKRDGGAVVGDDYYPLDVTDFSGAIAKIQAAKPDFVHSCLVGGPAMSFYRQWAAAGMQKKIPIVSIVFGGGEEHEILTPEESNGVIAAYNYFQELDTPRNRAFVEKLDASVGKNHPYVNGIAIGGYTGVMLWAEAVKKAGSFGRDAVMTRWPDGDGRKNAQHDPGHPHHQGREPRLEPARNPQADPALRLRRSLRFDQVSTQHRTPDAADLAVTLAIALSYQRPEEASWIRRSF
jgi:branched-chain amino acid transport system substrate-binding protein